MKTASFFLYTGPGRISISRSNPRGILVAGYRALAPGPWFKEVNEATYRELYAAQLARLDPQKVWADLHALVPFEPVLLCWEKLQKPGESCHRRMVAQWFKHALGHDVDELATVSMSKPVERNGELF